MTLKLHVLDLGMVRVDQNFIVANSTIVTQSTPDLASKLVDVPISAYFIQGEQGNVLYDTGCHPDCMGVHGRWTQKHQSIGPFIGGTECTLPHRLKELGITPDDVNFVVLSHLHNDHAGCVEFFRKSKILVHEDEFSGAMRHFMVGDHSTNYILADIAEWVKHPLNWRFIGRDEPDLDLINGVRLVNFGTGHAYGMLGLTVHLQNRRSVLLVSDACYGSTNFGPPSKRPGIMHDSIGYDRTIERMRQIAEEKDLDVWFGHDLEQFATLTKSTEGFYS